jgi:hypothetical protein
MGEVVVEDRAYYLCPACHAGHAPVDAALGLSARKLTPGAEELATLAGTVGSFAEAAEKLLPRMAGLRLCESTVQRTTEAAGQRLGTLGTGGHTLGPAAEAETRGRRRDPGGAGGAGPEGPIRRRAGDASPGDRGRGEHPPSEGLPAL